MSINEQLKYLQSLEYETVLTHFYRVKYPYFRSCSGQMGRPYPLISRWFNTSHLVVDMPKYWSFWQWIQKVGATLIFEQQNCLVNGVPKIWNCSNFLNSLSKTSIHWYINYQVWCVSPPKEEWVGPTHMGRTSPEIWVLYSVKMGENSFIFQWLYIKLKCFVYYI